MRPADDDIDEKSPRVAVVGYYGAGNLGDVLLLMSTVCALRPFYAAGEIAICSSDQPYLPKLVPGVRVVERSRVTLRNTLVVHGGGTQFFSFPRSAATFSTRARDALRSPMTALRSIGQRMTPVGRYTTACLGVGVGPFVDGSTEERRAREIMRRSEFVAVRDRKSLQQCIDWGASAAFLGTDLCFADAMQDQMPERRDSDNPLAVAVVIRAWPHSDEGAAFLEPMLEGIEHLRRDGHPVTFYSFCAADDRMLIRSLAERGIDVRVWDPVEDEIRDFLEDLGRHRVIVTARYHGAILGSLLGRPFVSVELEPKLQLVAEALSMEQYRWRQPFAAQALHAVVSRVFEHYGEASKALESGVARERERAVQMMRRFLEFLSARRAAT